MEETEVRIRYEILEETFMRTAENCVGVIVRQLFPDLSIAH